MGVGEGGSEGVGARETVKAQTGCNWITASVFNKTCLLIPFTQILNSPKFSLFTESYKYISTRFMIGLKHISVLYKLFYENINL